MSQNGVCRTFSRMNQQLTAIQLQPASYPESNVQDQIAGARGKFVFAGDAKFFVRGVTYGPFRPTENGCEYHNPERVERDFAAMAASGINAVRTYTVPPDWLL